ncbi:MAG: energy-coupled thiamine transporter ThiT [Clostridia bacterium]|nr:energy-coupled thiamine transporter ThiT [Clostridia bacterium]
MKITQIRKLTLSAVMLALATVLALVCALIPFLNLPFGGCITIASALPVIIISYMYGVKHGLFTSFAFALIQIVCDLLLGHSSIIIALFTPGSEDFGGFTMAIFVLLLDYLLAYTVLGLGGLFRNKLSKGAALSVGAVVALALRYLSHVISGAIFYGAWAEWFFTDTIAADWAISKWIMANMSGASLSLSYSLVYNACYMLPEIIITAALALVISRIPNIKKDEI